MLRKSRFFDYFPPPEFLTMPAVGVDISDRSIHFIQLVRKGRGFVLGKYGHEKIPGGLITEGGIEDAPALEEILTKLRKKHGLDFVRVSLPEQKGYLLKMKLPLMKRSEVRGSLELRLEENVPISPQNALFDYTTVECEPEKHKGHLDVGVAVMPIDVVSKYAEVFSGAGFTPLSFELEAHAIARAVLPENDCGTTMIVDIGATRTGISIVSEGIARYTATVNIGGDQLTEAVMKIFNLSKKEAQKKKEKEGLLQNREDKSMYGALIPITSLLGDEIKKRIIYWGTQDQGKGHATKKDIEKIILCGGEANVPGIKHYLATTLKINVELANPWMNIASFDDYIPEIYHNRSLQYVTALGLALHSHV